MHPLDESKLAALGCDIHIMCIPWILYEGADMGMHINLSVERETYIRSKVAGGFYGNATEVIRDAIRRMQAAEDRVLAWKAAIAQGDAELDRGEGIPYTAAALAEITRRAADESGLPPADPDVSP